MFMTPLIIYSLALRVFFARMVAAALTGDQKIHVKVTAITELWLISHF